MVEQGGRDPVAMRHMHRDGLSLVTARRQHHRRPEIDQPVDMRRPVIHGVVEDRTKPVVRADAGIEAFDQLAQAGLVDPFRLHGFRLRTGMPDP